MGKVSARERFIAKCEFIPETGCVLWRGGTTTSRDGTERTGVFWYEGKKHLARRWAAEHIHGIDLGFRGVKETSASCGDPLCVQHIHAEIPVYFHRQFYAVREKGYAGLTERKPPERTGQHVKPDWMKEGVKE
jgi:hypothetical protein